MSSITAGTSSGTALVHTADTTGQFVVKTGVSSVAGLTVDGNQVTTLANPLPVASGGTGSTSGVNLATGVTGILQIANGGTNSSATPTNGGVGYGTGTANAYTAAGTNGQYLQSTGVGAPIWANLVVPGTGVSTYSNVTAATTYTLTASSSNIIEIDAEAWNIKVVLPNATTLTANGNTFTIRNIGVYPIVIEDSTNVSIGGVPPASQVQIGLNSTATAAGVWVLDQNACFATEVSQIQTSLYSHSFTVRLSDTKFAVIGANAGSVGFSIQGFTLSGDVVTSGTLTNLRATAATFMEAKAIDANRVVVSYWSGANIFSIIADLTSIASPTIGTETTIASNFGASNTLLFRFDVKPVNDIGYYESTLTYSGRLTGTNKFVFLYGTNSGGTMGLNGFDCGASGTTITVATATSVGPLGGAGNNNYLFIGALSISSNSIGFAFCGDIVGGSGQAAAYSASLSGTTWTVNGTSLLGPGPNLQNSIGMRGGNTLLYFATRSTDTGNTGIYAIQFPSSGNVAPTTYNCPYTTQNNAAGMILTATGPVVLYLTNTAMQGLIYTPSVSLTSSVFSTGFSTAGSLSSAGYIDTTTCNTFTVTTGNTRFLANFTAGSIIGKNLNAGSATGGNFYGYSGSTNNFMVQLQTLTNQYYQKITRGTFDGSLNFSPTKTLGWNKFSAQGQGLGVRYCFQLGKYLSSFITGNQIVAPMSSSSTNGFLGDSGFRDYQISQTNLTGTTNAAQDIDSSRVVWVQTQSGLDSSTSLLPMASTATNVRISLLRIANV